MPDEYQTIQGAIDAAVEGDTVLVKPGTYVENIDFLGKAITVKSSQGPEVTVIDGGNPKKPRYGSVVVFKSGEGRDSVLHGFTLTNGSGSVLPPYVGAYGGWVYCNNASTLPVVLPPDIPGPYSIPMQAFIGDSLTNVCHVNVE